MRVLVLNPSASAGAYIHQLCNALVAAGAEVDLWTGPVHERSSRAWQSTNYQAKIRFYRYTQWRSWRPGMFRPAWRAARLIGHCLSILRLLAIAHRYDVVHIQFLSVPELDVFWLPLLRRRTTVAYTVHNLYPHDACRDRKLTALLHRIYDAVDILIVHTRATGDGLVSDFHVPPAKIIRIPHGNFCGVVAAQLVPDPASLALKSEGRPTILMIGGLRRNKGPDVLLRATAELRRRGLSIHTLFAGRHPSGDPVEYRLAADDLGIADLVEFRPHFLEEEQIPAYLLAAAIVVFPYLTIDQSGGAIWAISYGRPIIASRVGGLVDLIEGGAAVGVAPGDVNALASAIEHLVHDPEECQKLGTAGRLYAETQLAWGPIGEDLLVSYRTIVNRRRSAVETPAGAPKESS